MKFCPMCGNITNGSLKCDLCGYERTEEDVKKENDPNVSAADKFKANPEALKMMFKAPEEKINHAVELKELKSMNIDTGKIRSVSISSAGGMMGEYYSTNFNFDNKVIEVKEKKWHHGETTLKKYKVSDEVINKMNSVIEDANFAAWSKIDIDRSMIAMDAPSSSIYFYYEKGSYGINFNIYMTEEEKKIISDFCKLLHSSEEDENLISNEVIEQGQDFGSMLGFADPKNTNLSNKFCPLCGAQLNVDQKKCDCGYEIK